MPSVEPTGVRGTLFRYRGLIFPILIVMSVLVIITPLPPLVMDMLLACNITIAVLILLTTIYVNKPLDFSVFPTLLLGTTLARLVLNVASTRLILTRGAIDRTGAAGDVIEAFGSFVAGNNIVVGLILFIIFVAIQFLVITKGATRISEVAARFALDAMPVKQMAIDADLNAGAISQEQARKRRDEITEESDFYGAMDGASKFVRGDAIAGIVITLINVIGGLVIGMLEHGMPFMDAVQTFTTLTIGDGLVTQVPAFLISLAAGLLSTRTSSESSLSRDMLSQLFRHSEALFLAAGFLVLLSFTGMPMLPLMMLSSACIILGVNLKRGQKQIAEQQAVEEETQAKQAEPDAKPEDNLLVDALELELGGGLLRLVDPEAGGDLLNRVTQLRFTMAQELGILLPKIRIRDNIHLEPRQYQIKVRGVAVAWGEAYVDGLLAINTGAATGNIPGIDTIEPAFGQPAKWIEHSLRQRAEDMNYGVFEPTLVITTHLTEIINTYSHELLSRQSVHQLLDHVKKRSPKVVEELIPDLLKTSHVHQVLSTLLHERVPIRDLETVLETLSDYADKTRDVGILTEYVRHSLSRTICQQYRDDDRVIRVVTLAPGLEDILAAGMDYTERGLTIKLSPATSEGMVRALTNKLRDMVALGYPPVVLCNPQIRAGLKRITATTLPKLAVLSLNEITRDTTVEAIAHIEPRDLHPQTAQMRN